MSIKKLQPTFLQTFLHSAQYLKVTYYYGCLRGGYLDETLIAPYLISNLEVGKSLVFGLFTIPGVLER